MKDREICRTCNGTGVDECAECGHEIECNVCNGTGYWDEEEEK